MADLSEKIWSGSQMELLHPYDNSTSLPRALKVKNNPDNVANRNLASTVPRDTFVRSRKASAQASAQIQDLSANRSSLPGEFHIDTLRQRSQGQTLGDAMRGVPTVSPETPREVRFTGRRGASAVQSGERAKTELNRFVSDHSGAGRGRGRGRGGLRGRGRGRGREGGEGGSQRRKRENYGLKNDEEDEHLNAAQVEEEFEALTAREIFEDNPEDFENDRDLENYAELYDIVQTSDEGTEEAEEFLTQAGQTGNQDVTVRTEDENDASSEMIYKGLQKLVEAQNWTTPSHEPKDLDVVKRSRGQVGSVPTGQGGMGSVVEDGLRMLGERECHEWQDPKQLAQRLVDGEFVKFLNKRERNDVTRLAEDIGYSSDAAPGTVHVGFAPLASDARRTLLERLVRGRYLESKDQGLRNETLRNIARVAGGNASYRPAARATLLQTIQDMMPAERSTEQPRR